MDGAKDIAEDLRVEGKDEEKDGVLLYYKFVHIPEPEKIKSWLYSLSAALGLLGRIRVAPDGVNVTVGGKMEALEEHVACVRSNPLFIGTDFKLAVSLGPVDARVAAECGFTSLSARMVKELVTLGLHPSVEPPSVLNAGKHLSAWEFHEILQNSSNLSGAESRCDPIASGIGNTAHHGGGRSMQTGPLASQSVRTPSVGNCDRSSETESPRGNSASIEKWKKIVVLDARNLYETRIGKFSPPQGMEVLDPTIRQYSDLPRWIDNNEDRLRDNQILMYCTGGVRCEMASAYIRSKGRGFEDVLQLSGGIQRYLEAFPDGGYFAGKNFVFDHRLAVPSSRSDIMGRCLICSVPYDDYTSRCRCCLCRMLVIVCGKCQECSGEGLNGARYTCELCSQLRKNVMKMQPDLQRLEKKNKNSVSVEWLPALGPGLKEEQQARKLKILCLHGFRQNASSLKGRLNALRKKLRHRVEFVFVDAPHEIPSINVGSKVEPFLVDDARICDSQSGDAQRRAHQMSRIDFSATPSKKFAWFVRSEMSRHAPEIPAVQALVQNSHHNEDGRDLYQESQVTATVKVTSSTDAVTSSTFALKSRTTCETDEICRLSLEVCAKSSEGCMFNADKRETSTAAPQFQTQTEGWLLSLDHLKRVFSTIGPFDGVLGFSQGAAVAAALCTQRTSNDHPSQASEELNFRFAIICSGFWPKAVHFEEINSLSGCPAHIDCPSLHVFGNSPGVDRQIESHESEELAKLFNSDSRMIVRHTVGHIIPTQPPYVKQYLEFLSQFD